MNAVPFALRFAAGWPSIAAQVNQWALDHGHLTYAERPTAYRFEGWGVVFRGMRPCLACNVKLVFGPGQFIDLGRLVGE